MRQAESSWPVGSCTLDHDGCVVCSDIGIPVRVVNMQGDDALCEDTAGNQAMIAVDYVEGIQVGDVLLTHAGVAIGRATSLDPNREENLNEIRQ